MTLKIWFFWAQTMQTSAYPPDSPAQPTLSCLCPQLASLPLLGTVDASSLTNLASRALENMDPFVAV
jgi:hypothetical protein